MKWTNDLIRQNYEAAHGPELQRQADNSIPTWQVVAACALVIGIILFL